MNHDTTKSGIECSPVGPPVGPWEDDEPGATCSLCRGRGDLESPAGYEIGCPACGSAGVAP